MLKREHKVADDLEMLKLIGSTLTVRQKTFAGGRKVPYGFADLTLKKSQLKRTGWVCTRLHTTQFVTVQTSNPRLVIIKPVGVITRKSGVKYPNGIHVIKLQEHQTVRLGLRIGKFDFMDNFVDVLVEYDPIEDVLRVHLPDELTPFQSKLYK